MRAPSRSRFGAVAQGVPKGPQTAPASDIVAVPTEAEEVGGTAPRLLQSVSQGGSAILQKCISREGPEAVLWLQPSGMLVIARMDDR